MIKVIWDSFCRAIIRFFDNRFVKDDHNHYYEMEISRLRTQNENLQNRLLEIVLPKKESSDFVIDPNQEPLRRPIETTSARRIRLEKESWQKWQEQVNEARAKLDAAKTQVLATDDLEKSVGIG